MCVCGGGEGVKIIIIMVRMVIVYNGVCVIIIMQISGYCLL